MSDGGYVYATPGEYHHVDLRDSSSMFPQIGEELYSHIAYVFKCPRLEAVQILALARSKYTCVNFRKKGRRKLKRSMRIHRKNWHSRSKTNASSMKRVLDSLPNQYKEDMFHFIETGEARGQIKAELEVNKCF